MSTQGTLLHSSDAEFVSGSVLAQTSWMLLFAGATAIGARLEVPHEPVPYTLQTMVVLLAGAFLGARNGALSQIMYITSGLLGLPVFAGGGFGFATLLGPTGGYLLAFPAAALITGGIIHEQKGSFRVLVGMVGGLAVIFAGGGAGLFLFTHDLQAAFWSGVMAFSWWDAMKLGAAVMMYREIGKRWPLLPMPR